ncbi:MAG TPA: hypothetical protein VLK58_28230 [Conexibacter sp.]|nr:hypothetical protein [Conexibacter sp.]
MSIDATQRSARFDPASFERFRFTGRELSDDGVVTLRYALDERIEFAETFTLPLPEGTHVSAADRARVDGLLSLLHWVAGVSYFKIAVPPAVVLEGPLPGPAAAALLEALYSEGLGEFAFTNRLPALPRPVFPRGAGGASAGAVDAAARDDASGPRRILVPVGGGKDSVVALEIARRSGREVSLFSIGDAPPIVRTVAVAGLPHLLARRRLDAQIGALNRAGALNGHVPVTAIVSCVALLTASLHGFDAVAMANERSASHGNVAWDGIDVNHQFSKSLRTERLLRAALSEVAAPAELFSLLRPASELGIARAFARLEDYHPVFTSCNAIFRIDPALRAASWCCDCPKCRFVYLILAPFLEPAALAAIFGRDLLGDPAQYDGFALLTATGGHKPFECVGEEQESLAAIRLIAAQPRWRDHAVVRRLAAEVLPAHAAADGDLEQVLALSDDHEVPAALMPDVRALLGA